MGLRSRSLAYRGGRGSGDKVDSRCWNDREKPGLVALGRQDADRSERDVLQLLKRSSEEMSVVECE